MFNGDQTNEEEVNQWLKTMPDKKVFDWLGDDANGIPRYAHLLNLEDDSEDSTFDLRPFQNAARKLAEEPEYLRELIRTDFWRHTLVGVVSLILLQAEEYYADLKFSFEEFNFVSPQIAVAIGLLCRDEAAEYFSNVVKLATPRPAPERFKTDFTIHCDAKRIAAAQTVLAKLNPALAEETAKSEVLRRHQEDMDGKIGASVAGRHWEFWSKVVQSL